MDVNMDSNIKQFAVFNNESNLIPINEVLENEFPLAALPRSLQEIIGCLHQCINAPVAICAQGVFSAISLAVQSLYDVEIDGRVYPTSLFFLTIAKSGERKSEVDNATQAPINKWEEVLHVKYQADRARYESLLDDLKSAPKKGNDAMRLNLRPPMEPNIIASDPTVEGILSSFKTGQPSIGLFNDEGGSFLFGYGMSKDTTVKTITNLSLMFSGKPLSRMRAKESTTKIYNKRLSIHLMIQPRLATSLLSDEVLFEQGFLARFLICYPASLIGYRPYSQKHYSLFPVYQNYYSKVYDLISKSRIYDDQLENTLIMKRLSFSDAAALRFRKFDREIEENLASSGLYSDILPSAGKACELTARLSCVIEVYTNDSPTEISLDSVESAIKLIVYYLNEARRILRPEAESKHITESKMTMDAENLITWIIDRVKKNNTSYITWSDLTQSAPRAVRSKIDYMRTIINKLVSSNYLLPLEHGKGERWILNRKLMLKNTQPA